MNWESRILELLAASLLRPFILVVAGLLILRAFRVSHPASKHAVWTAVLAGMLLLPFLSVMAPRVDVPALPQRSVPAVQHSLENATQSHIAVSHPKTETKPEAARLPPEVSAGVPSLAAASLSPAHATPSAPREIPVRSIIVWCYLAGAIAFGTYRVVGWILLRRLLSRSRPLRLKPLRESDDVTIPIAVGVWRPAIVLPSGWRRWNASTRRSILAHELAHLRRKDAWVLALSRWVKGLFWFHPLAWWISRKTSELAEMTCDAAVVETVGNPADYAKILLEFSSMVQRRGYRAALPGLAMVGRSPLSRRIEHVLAPSNGTPRRLRRPGVVLALIGIPALGAASTLGLTAAVSRPLLQAKVLVAAQLEAVVPASLGTPLAALSLSFFEPEGVKATPPQGPPISPREFLDRNCVTCHNSTARIGGIALDHVNPATVQADSQFWERAVKKLRGGFKVISAPGAPRPDPVAVRGFVDWLESELDRGAPVYPRAALPHRLNRTEYRNAIRDLLSIDIDPALLFPEDDFIQGFDNLAEAQAFSRVGPELYKTAAERVSKLVLESPSRRSVFICRPAVQAEAADCARKIVANLTARAFRGQETADDIARLTTIYQTSPKFYSSFSVYDFERATELALQAILTDQKFLHRTEREPENLAAGQTYRISDLELASRLSFFLWSRGPDDQLLELARRGQLRETVILERETRRMLKDPRAAALTTNFASQWLWLRNLQRTDPILSYTDFDEPLRQAMRRETELFFSSIVQDDRNVMDLITANYTFLNERLARHYGIPNVSGPEFRRVTLSPAFDVRRGLLGKASFLTVTSNEDRTSPITRGKVVQERFLGAEPPHPPPSVNPLPLVLNLPMRRVMEEQDSVNPACVSCHKIFLPVGLALDNFDLAGKWRTQENGATIDPVTELNDGTRLSGAADVRNAIVARSDLFLQNFAGRLLTYALGRRTGPQDMPLIRAIARDTARDGNRFSAFIVGIVKSAPFQMNVKG
jgi:beta-lactamase regulating signal transducer with metallopeptidase domain